MKTTSFVVLVGLCIVSIDCGLPGGFSKADVNDETVVRLSKYVADQLNQGAGATPKKYKVIEAEKQVVSGLKVKLTFEAKSGEDVETCKVTVWDRPWLSKTEILDVQCQPLEKKKTKRSADKDEEYKDLQMFHSFMKKHNKQYDNKAEYKKRFHIFRANLKKIQFLQETEQGTAKYGPTFFTDVSQKEFKQYLGLNLNTKNKKELPKAAIPEVELPVEFDWRDQGAVTAVKNQGMCGSCWAFSVTGNIEGQWAIKRGKLLELSEQELVDCDKTDDGCSGGYMTNAYDSIIQLGGLETETDYPYDGIDEKCQLNKTEIEVTIDGAVNITKNETEMAQWLFQNGPISIGLNANAMQFYMGGISHPLKMLCDPSGLDHGVLAVGFGVGKTRFTHKVLPYWIIKNSWGTRWGEKGYYRLYRGGDACGVSQMASSAIINSDH